VILTASSTVSVCSWGTKAPARSRGASRPSLTAHENRSLWAPR